MLKRKINRRFNLFFGQINATPAIYTEMQEKKLLLKQMQPPTFKEEGRNVEKEAEVWVEAMDDYFRTTGTSERNRSMLARFRLAEDAKLWWKQHCKDVGVDEGS